MRIIFIYIIPSLIVSIFMCFFGIKIDSILMPTILSLLVAIAGAIFTIMSIWVAFLYPNVLKTLKGENLVNVDFSAAGDDNSRLQEIISVILQSAITLIIAVVLLILVSVEASFCFNCQKFITFFCQFGILFISGLQISALVSTMRINLSFMSILDKHRRKRAKDRDT